MDRACDRILAAVDVITKGNTSIFGACEAVINGAKLPTPRLDLIYVRATKDGSYANGRRIAGVAFYIRSEDEFDPGWMEKIDEGVTGSGSV